MLLLLDPLELNGTPVSLLAGMKIEFKTVFSSLSAFMSWKGLHVAKKRILLLPSGFEVLVERPHLTVTPQWYDRKHPHIAQTL